jgi:sugar transferase (PEP-CTERM/EpsH1 system associated)
MWGNKKRNMPKNVLQVTLSMARGGLERIVYEIIKANGGSDKLFKMHWCCLDNGGAFYDVLQAMNVQTAILHRRKGKLDLSLLRKLVDLLRTQKIQVIHSHSGCILYSALAGRIAGVERIIHTEHGRYLPEGIGTIWEDRICSRLIDYYVCVSHELKEYMIRTVKVKQSKLRVILNGVNPEGFRRQGEPRRKDLREKYRLNQDAIIVGTVCRLQPVKNIIFLVNWVKTYFADNKNIVLVIVGEGTQLPVLKRAAEGVGQERIIFMGAREDIPDILNIFDIFVLPSYSEGMPLTVLEAMASEVPVIVSNVGDNSKIVKNGESGFVFAVNDDSDFHIKISTLISDGEMRKRMGYEGRRLVERRYSQERMIQEYYQLYG